LLCCWMCKQTETMPIAFQTIPASDTESHAQMSPQIKHPIVQNPCSIQTLC
jgi:hypothetical protein